MAEAPGHGVGTSTIESREVLAPTPPPADRPVHAVTEAAPDPEAPGRAVAPFADRWRSRLPLLREAFGAAWLPWLTARIVVAFTLALAHYELSHFHIVNPKAALQTHLGLLGSDAGWYQNIAAHGYGAFPRAALRFFPLLPLLDRGIHVVTTLTVGISSLLVVNAAALATSMGLYVLVRRELADALVARRAVWLLNLAPPAFVLVMGYSEALFLLLAVACFLALRRATWWWAAAFAYLAGLARPIGCLLALPALIEVVRAHRVPTSGPRWLQWLGRAAPVVAPVAGTATFLGYTAAAFGSFLEPLRVQQQSSHHGGLADPVVTVYHAVVHSLHGHHLGTALHTPWILVAAVLLVIAFRTLPASYGWFAAAILAVALSGTNLDSFERYALSAFPLVVAGATLLRSPRVALATFAVCAAALCGYALLAFQGAYVP